MLDPSLRSKKKIEYPPPRPPTPGGHEKTVRSPTPPPLIQGRHLYDRPLFCISVMNLLYFETSSHVNEYVILDGGGGKGDACDGFESCSIER